MVALVACVGEGKGTWTHVNLLIAEQDWEKVFLITNEFGKQNFKTEKPAEIIVVNEEAGLREMIDAIKKTVEGKLFGDVAVNLISGNGKMHMATISALLQSGAGIRFVALTKDGIKEF